MKKLFCIILLVLCCNCSKLKGPAGIGILTGTETGVIAAQVLSCTTLEGAIAGAAVGFVGGSLIEENMKQEERNIKEDKRRYFAISE